MLFGHIRHLIKSVSIKEYILIWANQQAIGGPGKCITDRHIKFKDRFPTLFPETLANGKTQRKPCERN